jgi:hypothetical protein
MGPAGQRGVHALALLGREQTARAKWIGNGREGDASVIIGRDGIAQTR